TLQNLTVSLVSFYDLARLPEAVFHAFVLGLLANLRSIYDIRSNAESGLGRADILMIPKTAGYPIGYVIEFKSIYPDDDMEKSAQEALTQIRERKYDASVLSGGTEPDNIRYLAIVLQGKNVMVKE
ncbi:PD-(D/E)XK nuclease domain-containing protein, partial [Methanospirillum hungatei]|uniref:PD-(D/E)XK nuclease domain-containing protein n=1 Tax=Methanospirillum hungatei TaxID=2203 RepID=UPI002CA35A88